MKTAGRCPAARSPTPSRGWARSASRPASSAGCDGARPFLRRVMARVPAPDFVNAPVADGELPTSRSMIFVSPDGERSMNTYLGISTELGPEDVDDGRAPNCCSSRLPFDKDQGQGGGRRPRLPLSPCPIRSASTATAAISAQTSWRTRLRDRQRTRMEVALRDRRSRRGAGTGRRRQRADRLHPLGPRRGAGRGRGDGVPVPAGAPLDATGAGDQFAAIRVATGAAWRCPGAWAASPPPRSATTAPPRGGREGTPKGWLLRHRAGFGYFSPLAEGAHRGKHRSARRRAGCKPGTRAAFLGRSSAPQPVPRPPLTPRKVNNRAASSSGRNTPGSELAA